LLVWAGAEVVELEDDAPIVMRRIAW